MAANYQQYPFPKGKHPPGWVETTVGEVMLEIRSGYSSGKHNQTGQGIPHLRPMNVSSVGDISMEDVRYVAPSAGSLRLAEDDVLFTNTSSTVWVGKTAVVKNPGEWGFSNHMTRLRVADGMSPEFVARQLHYLCLSGYFAFHCKKHINQSSVAGMQLAQEVPFRLPPAKEQKRITAKLRRLLARERKLRRQLDALPELIQQYRAAVLEAACTGRLVPTEAELAREAHCEFEPASVLLERILHERRAKWETDQLAKMRAAGKEPKDDKWKRKYPIPLKPSESFPVSLPTGWAQVSLDQLSLLVTSGSRDWGNRYSEQGRLFIRAQDIKTDTLNIGQVVRVRTPDNAEAERSKTQNGDLLITITGANVAKAALAVGLGEAAFVSQHVGLVRPVYTGIFQYCQYWVTSPGNGRSQLETVAYGAGKPGLNLQQLRELSIALPPLSEQRRIIAEVERRLAALENIKTQISAALDQTTKLRTSLFHCALSGKLVDQHRNDEPAKELLARIRIEREKRKQTPKRAKLQRKANMKKLSPEVVKEAISKLPKDRFSFDELSTALQADYDPLKDIVFELLGEPKPTLRQAFDSKAKTMHLQRIEP